MFIEVLTNYNLNLKYNFNSIISFFLRMLKWLGLSISADCFVRMESQDILLFMLIQFWGKKEKNFQGVFFFFNISEVPQYKLILKIDFNSLAFIFY